MNEQGLLNTTDRRSGRYGLLLLLLTLVLAACAGGPGAEQTEMETAEAFIGSLSAGATASGELRPLREASISAATPARVTDVFVRVGDEVATGDPLLQLSTDDLEFSVANAAQTVRLREASLADLLDEPDTAELAAAEAGVTTARIELDDLLDGVTPEEIAIAEANLRAAEAALGSASAELNNVQTSVTSAQIEQARAAVYSAEQQLRAAQDANEELTNAATDQTLRQAQQQVASAKAQLDALLAGPDSGQIGAAQGSVTSAQANVENRRIELERLQTGPTAAQEAAARARLAQAEANLATLVDGPTAEDIATAEAELAQARLSLADAEDALADATITAPFPGFVAAINAQPGEIASGIVAEIVDLSSLQTVLEVDEVDISALAPGQPVTVTLETWPNDELSGSVASIAPAPNNAPGSNLITYEVRLNLDPTALPVRAGMTANASILTDERDDVLLVPNAAILADRASGTFSVRRVVGDTTEEVPVTIGQRDNRYTIITDGLEAGDMVVIGGGSPNDEDQFGGPFGG